MKDYEQEIRRENDNGYCPTKDIDDNPIFYYIKYLIFSKLGKFEFEKNERDKLYNTKEEMNENYKKGDLESKDLKSIEARVINKMNQPDRKIFEIDIKTIKILQIVKSFKVIH